jgi:hypothetical protein
MTPMLSLTGVVREAFRKRGYDAWSCDLIPAEDSSPYHLQGDVLKLLTGGKLHCLGSYAQVPREWYLMIGFPDCTYLCNSGVRHLYIGGRSENGPDDERREKMLQAAAFFHALLKAPVERICLENPIMHSHASESLGWKYSQIIQPWQFGHGETKATCLWLKNLPLLKPTKIVEGRIARVHCEPPSPERWKNRSRTLPGIAEAMAEQWGGLEK